MGRREWHRSMAKGKREALPAGCMSGMLHFFDFHNILFSSGGGGGGGGGRRVPQCSPPQRKCNQVKSNVGVEAPRNSLELDETAAAAAATMYTASALADEEYFGIPIGIQVKAVPSLRRKQISREDLLALAEEEKRTTSQCGTPRTPNVVARLMGLEILPDGASTPTAGFRSQGHSPKLGTKKTTVSVDCPPRKEPPQRRQPLGKRDTNILAPNPRLEVGSRSLPETPRASSERPREDPRLSLQIVNKENINSCDVSRSLPPSPVACATIHVSSRWRRKDGSDSKSQSYAREIVKQVKESIQGHGRDQSPDSGSNVTLLIKSRRTRPTDKRVVVNAEKSPPPPRFFEPPKPPRPQPKPKENADPNKCKKAGVERFTERIVRQPPPPAETATQPSKNRGLQPSTSSSSAELWYVRSILERGGVMSTKPRWPIDPFVFHQLELDPPLAVQCNPGPLRHRCNRKLMFHLVVEILSDLLGGPTSRSREMLLDGVWARIRGLPSADCQVMDDIDGLVAGDIAGANVRGLAGHPLVAAEAAGIAAEIAADVLDCAIGEAAAALALCSRSSGPFPTSR